jgi:hypothetical protein
LGAAFIVAALALTFFKLLNEHRLEDNKLLASFLLVGILFYMAKPDCSVIEFFIVFTLLGVYCDVFTPFYFFEVELVLFTAYILF